MEDIRNGATVQQNPLDGCVQVCESVCVCVCVCVSACVWLAPQSVCISADSALPNPSTLHFFTDFPPLLCPHLLSSLHCHTACLLALCLNSSHIPFHYPFRPFQSCQKTEKRPSATSSVHTELQTTQGSGHQAISRSGKVRAWYL